MQYFGRENGNDTPFWQMDYIPQLENTISFFDFCTASQAASSEQPAEADTEESDVTPQPAT